MGYSTKIKLGSANQLDIGVIMILEAIKNDEGANNTGYSAKIKCISANN